MLWVAILYTFSYYYQYIFIARDVYTNTRAKSIIYILLYVCTLGIDHSPPSIAEVKNEWSYTSFPPKCFHSVDRDRWRAKCREYGTYGIRAVCCVFLFQNLTGGKKGGLFITDVTNASRTMLMNIESLQWDPILCRYCLSPSFKVT